jgi:hypothetical protein
MKLEPLNFFPIPPSGQTPNEVVPHHAEQQQGDSQRPEMPFVHQAGNEQLAPPDLPLSPSQHNMRIGSPSPNFMNIPPAAASTSPSRLEPQRAPPMQMAGLLSPSSPPKLSMPDDDNNELPGAGNEMTQSLFYPDGGDGGDGSGLGTDFGF